MRKSKIDINFDRPNSKKQYWFVIKELTGREIKRKYARSYLGIVWSVLNPLLNMIVMSLIFSYMFRRSIENFPVYYIIGQTMFSLFSTATNHSMTAIVDNKNLIQRTKLPKQTFVLSRIYTAFVNFLYTLIPLVGILLFFRIKPTWRIIFFLPDVILLMVFSIGVGYILSTAYVFFADIKHLYGIVLTIVMYMSAIFYPADRLPEFMQQVLALNPVYLSIDIARYTVMYGLMPYYTEWIKLAMIAFVSFGLGLFIYKKNENYILIKL